MDYDQLLQDPQILALRDELHALRDRGRMFSDVVDGEGHQYVDLVMEGGGTLGLALVGYIWALEEAGIRFLGIGGTSAGSIGAMLLAGLDVPQAQKAPALMETLGAVDFIDFVDGGYAARKLADAISTGATVPALGWGVLHAARLLFGWARRWGINPGDAFEQWLEQSLRAAGIDDLQTLEQRMHTRPKGLGLRDSAPAPEAGPRDWKLAIITADVATQTKVVFPRMGELYFNLDQTHPARFVRASMAIPLFFRALRPKIPRDGNYKQRWDEMVGTRLQAREELPAKAILVDGGLLSNFPISEFHVRGAVPHRPTFGVKLGDDSRVQHITDVFGFLVGMFNSARRVLDYDFLRRNEDYRQLVARVDTAGYSWLKFSMDESEQRGLIKAGAQAAFDFLRGFDWAGYKALRTALAQAHERQAESTAHEGASPPAA